MFPVDETADEKSRNRHHNSSIINICNFECFFTHIRLVHVGINTCDYNSKIHFGSKNERAMQIEKVLLLFIIVSFAAHGVNSK